MDQKIELMEVDEPLTDDYNFDELIETDLKNNDSRRLEPREILTVSIILILFQLLTIDYISISDTYTVHS